jgi:hypothetical protein
MPNLSLRGLDDATLARIRALARRRRVSVNRLIVETLRRQYGARDATYDDLDALAGTWSKAQAQEFEAAVAPFAEVEPALWAAEPEAVYGRRPARRKRARR